MRRKDMKDCLALGGEFNCRVGDTVRIETLAKMAKAAVAGGGKVVFRQTERLSLEEIKLLCKYGAGHVAFPDIPLDPIDFEA